jgi:glycosyltransferase involved in cell wall biosynthesis
MRQPGSRGRRPRVSVVTPSYNQGYFLERALRSVLCQDYPDLEYLVVDGLSDDDSPAVLARYLGGLDELIREADAGQADALDKGFRRATGDVLAYINADDGYAGPGVVSRAVAYFERHPGVDVVFGQRLVIDEDGYLLNRWPRVPFDAAALRQVDFIPQECCFWRRSAYERAGGYVDRRLDFAVDYDLWLRLLASGARFLSVRDRFGLFREHRGQKSRTRWREHGWPEVQALHARHAGRAFTEAEAEAAFDRQVYGRGPGRLLRRAAYRAGNAWARFLVNRLRARPLDAWTLGRPVGRRRRTAA